MKRTSGFTVIELVSTVAFVLLICGLIVLQKNNIEAAQRDQQRKTAVNSIYYGLKEAYFVQHGAYPSQIQASLLPYVNPDSFKQVGEDAKYAIHYQGLDCDGDSCKGFVITNKLEKESTYKKTN